MGPHSHFASPGTSINACIGRAGFEPATSCTQGTRIDLTILPSIELQLRMQASARSGIQTQGRSVTGTDVDHYTNQAGPDTTTAGCYRENTTDTGCTHHVQPVVAELDCPSQIRTEVSAVRGRCGWPGYTKGLCWFILTVAWSPIGMSARWTHRVIQILFTP